MSNHSKVSHWSIVNVITKVKTISNSFVDWTIVYTFTEANFVAHNIARPYYQSNNVGKILISPILDFWSGYQEREKKREECLTMHQFTLQNSF